MCRWLLLALLLRSGPGRAGRCQRGELRPVWGGDSECCPRCAWDREAPAPCAAAQSHECKCPQGFSCSDEPCQFCRRVPGCEPGWEPHRIGTVNFQFECKPCENGSYSSSRNRWCRPWTDCESIGFVTLRPGNSTHNSMCGPHRALEPARDSLEFPPSPVLAVLAAVAVFLLLLLSFLLHLCLWSLRRDPKFPPGDLGGNFPRPLQGEESHSIQFPEEEHGDKTAPEKISSLSLKVYSELG